jgi:ADP-heptose:LPS heptosyltransferase
MKNFVEALERTFRNHFVYPLLRRIFRNPVAIAFADINHVNRILIFRYDRIGDMIITTAILRLLKQLNPHVRLDVLASKANQEIVRLNPSVGNLIVLEENWLRLIRQILTLRKQRYDMVLNFIFNRTTGPGILANLVAPLGFKVGQGPDRYAFYFNRLVKVRRFEQHMLESYVTMIEDTFGMAVDREQLAFELIVDADTRQEVDVWLESQSIRRKSQPTLPGLPYLVLNPSAKDGERSLTPHQVAALVGHLSRKPQFRLVVLESPGNTVMNKALRGEPVFQSIVMYRTHTTKPLGELASLIDGAFLVVSPDTSIVHFASAMHTPVLAIYAPRNASREWLPYRVPYEIVMAGQNQRISDIGYEELIVRVDQFVGTVLRTRAMSIKESK